MGRKVRRPVGWDLRRRGPVGPISTRWLAAYDDAAWIIAWRLADGDESRLRREPDGSVTVHNGPTG